MRILLRRFLFVAAAIAALVLGVFLWNGLGDAHPAAVRNQYLKGEITLEEARKEVGDVADSWVELKNRRPD